MQLLSKTFLFALVGYAAAVPAPATPSKAGRITYGNIPAPPGLDISKHKTPPPEFNITTYHAQVKKGHAKKPGNELEKRDPSIARLFLFDNWNYGGEVVELDVVPNSYPFLIQWYTDLDDRVSSFVLSSDSYPEKACTLAKDYYWDGNGNVQCSGTTITVWSGYGSPSSDAIPALVGDLNDALSCVWCWADY
ncbi:hypothetical protein TWF694_006327 [Orbilia ellipsospora]|uniref:Uncharacterized protein n=1 Tax=Orbilia ellipsospora TaxID=2528407 RepID=A0AAV9XMC8_9PEZI